MRQSYQANSYQNELVPQDIPRTPQTPNYFFSSPTSPKVVQPQTFTYNPPSPNIMNRQQVIVYKESSSRPQARVDANDYNMKRR
jgi:hypothetical protein